MDIKHKIVDLKRYKLCKKLGFSSYIPPYVLDTIIQHYDEKKIKEFFKDKI